MGLWVSCSHKEEARLALIGCRGQDEETHQ